MSFLKPKVYMPPAPAAPPSPGTAGTQAMEKAVALAEEAQKQARKKKGAGATIVAGALEQDAASGGASGTGGTPTLLG